MPTRNSIPSRSSGFSLIELLVVVVIIGLIMVFAVPAASSLLKGPAVLRGANALTDELSRARQHALSKNRVVEVRLYKFADPDVMGETVADETTWHFRALQSFEVSSDTIAEKDGGGVATGNKINIRNPIGKYTQLPEFVIMSTTASTTTLSSLLMNPSVWSPSAAPVPPWPTPPTPPNKGGAIKPVDPELPRGIAFNYKYVAFQFLPDGTTNLPPDSSQLFPPPAPPTAPTTPLSTIIPSCVSPTSTNTLWFLTIQLLKDDGKVPPQLANFATWIIDPVSGTSKTLRPGQ